MDFDADFDTATAIFSFEISRFALVRLLLKVKTWAVKVEFVDISYHM